MQSMEEVKERLTVLEEKVDKKRKRRESKDRGQPSGVKEARRDGKEGPSGGMDGEGQGGLT